MHNVGQLSSYNTYNWIPLTSEFKIKYNNILKNHILKSPYTNLIFNDVQI